MLRLNLRCCPAEKIKVLRFLQGIDNQMGSIKNTRMKLTLKMSGGYIFAVLIGCPEVHIYITRKYHQQPHNNFIFNFIWISNEMGNWTLQSLLSPLQAGLRSKRNYIEAITANNSIEVMLKLCWNCNETITTDNYIEIIQLTSISELDLKYLPKMFGILKMVSCKKGIDKTLFIRNLQIMIIRSINKQKVIYVFANKSTFLFFLHPGWLSHESWDN